MYPSVPILERRASNVQWLLSRPVPTFTVSLCVLNEPYEPLNSAYGFIDAPSVCILTLAPKAPAPFVDVPAPRCTCISFTEEEKSGIFTQNRLWLSASFIGMPFTVMLIRVPSVPRTRSVV